MFGIGGFELLLILVFCFLIFGPEKLPAIANVLGKAVKKFQETKQEVDTIIKEDVYDPKAEEPFKDPTAALDKLADVADRAVKSGKDEINAFREANRNYQNGEDAPVTKEKAVAQEETRAQEPAMDFTVSIPRDVAEAPIEDSDSLAPEAAENASGSPAEAAINTPASSVTNEISENDSIPQVEDKEANKESVVAAPVEGKPAVQEHPSVKVTEPAENEPAVQVPCDSAEGTVSHGVVMDDDALCAALSRIEDADEASGSEIRETSHQQISEQTSTSNEGGR